MKVINYTYFCAKIVNIDIETRFFMNKHYRFLNNHWFKMILSFSVIIMILAVFLFFPKNVSRLALFAVFFISDYYIWRVYRDWFLSQRMVLQKILVSLYWIPSFFLLISMIRVLFVGYDAFINPYVYFFSGLVLLSFIVKFVFALFLLFADFTRYMVLHLKRFRFSYRTHIVVKKRDKYIVWAGVTSSLLFVVLFLWGGFVDNNTIQINRVEVRSKVLPKSFDDFKIVHISDIHFVSWVNKQSFSEVVDVINNQNADLVVFTGDLVTYRTSEAFDFIPYMKRVKSKYGVYAILGNHDYGEYIHWKSPEAKEDNVNQLYRLFKEANWRLLLNQHDYIVNSNNDSIALIGVENWSKSSRFKSKGDIDKALLGVSPNMFKILLTHDPSHWEELIKRKMEIDLTLSGHTHGMQFAIMNEFVNISPIAIIQKYWAGLYLETIAQRNCYLYVNTGLGTVSYPSRYGVPPEVVLITLKSN